MTGVIGVPILAKKIKRLTLHTALGGRTAAQYVGTGPAYNSFSLTVLGSVGGEYDGVGVIVVLRCHHGPSNRRRLLHSATQLQ